MKKSFWINRTWRLEPEGLKLKAWRKKQWGEGTSPKTVGTLLVMTGSGRIWSSVPALLKISENCVITFT